MEQTFGFAWRTATPMGDSIRIDAGSVWTQQRNIEGTRRHFIAVRAALAYKRPLPSGAHLQHAMEAVPNMETNEDWRFNSETAVVAPLSKALGLKLSYLVRYDHLPEPTFRTTDRVMTAGLQVTY
jgi:putative salt-induced outer membrane protein